MTRKSFGFIAILLLLFAHTGCSPKQVASVTTHATTTTTDSTSTLITERLVPVYFPADTLVYYAEVECPDGMPPAPIIANVNSSRSSLDVKLQGSQLQVMSNCKEWKDSVKVRDAEIHRLKTLVKSSDTKETVPVKYIPKIYVYAMWYACIDIGQKLLRLLLKAVFAYFKIQLPFKIPFL